MKHKKFLMMGLCLGLLSLSLAVFTVQAQDEQEILDELVSEYVTEDNAAVAIQVTTPDGIWSSAAGLADGERAATPDDHFRIGSMSKTFVAVAALLLVEDGVFSLDDPASKWLPSDVVENIANVDSVTIRQLLAMRSGIDDYLATAEFWDAVLNDPTHDWTAEEALKYAYGLEPLFAPDEGYTYSNTNYLLIQLILEKASGMPLHELIRTRILDPLNMQNTYTQARETSERALVHGYEDVDEDGTVDEVSTLNDGAGLGDGALVSTVADVSTFYMALLHEESILNEASMKELLSFQDDGEGGGYSLGLGEYETDYGNAIGHSGGVSGFVSDGFYLPEYEAVVIVFVASADGAPNDIGMAAVDALLSEDEDE